MTRKPRIDTDALRERWPDLFGSAPQDDEFIHREGQLQIDLAGVDPEALSGLARHFQLTTSGLVLLVVFEFAYGHYALARMRRGRAGLFKGFPNGDPAPWPSLQVNAQGLAEMAAPRRLVADLQELARKQDMEASLLAGLAIRRFLEGHLSPAGWAGSRDWKQ